MAKGLCLFDIYSKVPYVMKKFLTYDNLSSEYQTYIANSFTTEVVKDPRWVEAKKMRLML